MKRQEREEIFLWDLDSFTPRMFVQMERDGFNVEIITELNTVMVTKIFGRNENEKSKNRLSNKLE